MSSSRTIVIGDIHACYEELLALLDLINIADKDEIISIGDLVDRGPNPNEVVDFFMKRKNAHVILGNHEDKHIRIADKELEPSLSQKICIEQFNNKKDEYINFFRTLPLFLPRRGFVLVHAGLLPGLPPEHQPRNTLIRGRMPWMQSNYDKRYGGWWKHYSGSVPVVYGHSVFPHVHIENNTYGLDTGACHGHALSAMILESREIVQVESKEDYWTKIRQQYT